MRLRQPRKQTETLGTLSQEAVMSYRNIPEDITKIAEVRTGYGQEYMHRQTMKNQMQVIHSCNFQYEFVILSHGLAVSTDLTT